MVTHPYDSLRLANSAQLIFTPCPGTKEATLAQSLKTLKEAGTNILITLMYDQELQKNDALALASECAAQNIQWLQLPIADDAAPNGDFEQRWLAHKEQIIATAKEQGVVAVHCKGGSGRTGLVIALILVALGYSAEQAIAQVQTIRPKALTHATQLNYFNAFITDYTGNKNHDY